MPSATAISVLKRGLLFSAVWLALAGPDPEGLAFGAAAVAGAVWLSLGLLPPVHPLRPLRLAAMLPAFLWRSLLGSLDVARRALAPRPRLNPRWRVRRVALPEAGRVALGAKLSLMPGTLVAGADGDRLYLHLLDAEADSEAELESEARGMAALMGRPPDP